MNGSNASLRSVAVDSDIIGYRLHRVRRRTIGFQINAHGLSIRAPRWATVREIETAIVDNRRWIRRKQVEWQHWRAKQQADAPRLVDHGSVRYLGASVTLRLCSAADACPTHFDQMSNQIRLALPASVRPEAASDAEPAAEVARSLEAWFQMQARSVFARRIEHFVERADPRFAGWRLSSARTQWGSCSHNGRIRLNWRLIHFSMPMVDYVIAHELAHLRELNHSLSFWREVARLMPGFEAARDQIKRVEIDQISF